MSLFERGESKGDSKKVSIMALVSGLLIIAAVTEVVIEAVTGETE